MSQIFPSLLLLKFPMRMQKLIASIILENILGQTVEMKKKSINTDYSGDYSNISSWLMSPILGLDASGLLGDSESLLTFLFLEVDCSSSLLYFLLPSGDPGDSSGALWKLKLGSLPKYSTETLLYWGSPFFFMFSLRSLWPSKTLVLRFGSLSPFYTVSPVPYSFRSTSAGYT